MRARMYAVYDGVEYQARELGRTEIALLLPQSRPCPEGWKRSSNGYWRGDVPRATVEKLFRVFSEGWFEGMSVGVHDIYAMAETAWVFFAGRADEVPEHPAFEKDQDPGTSGWTAIVPWSSLTDVTERIEPIPIVPLNPYS